MITRRRAILSGATAAGSLLPQWSAAAENDWPFDFANPEDNVTLYAKIAGSLTKRTTYLQYYGEIYSVIPNEVQKPILGLKGIVVSRWAPNEDGSYSYRNFDHGLFCDYETGTVLEEYNNPFTGDVNVPLHYRSGPLADTVSIKREDGSAYILPWRKTGDQISVTQTRVGQGENPLSPDEWPRASTGKTLYFNTSSTYIANADEVADPARDAVAADHIWTFLTPFPAWMLVGTMPGFAMWRWVGRKSLDANELDPYIVAEIEKRVPDFFTSEEPWQERSNGWTQYKAERTPVSQ